MAGSSKPNINGLKKEASYKVLNGNSNGQQINQCGLFNENTPNEWNTKNVFYWYSSSDYLEIEINNDCNIYRSGTYSWATYTGELSILKFKNGEYIDITEFIEQKISPITNEEWEKTIFNLKKGRYKFVLKDTKYRIDSEWYIENIHNFKYLIKQNNEYYSLESSLCKLGQPQNNEELEQWYKEHGIDDLDILCTDENLVKSIKKEIGSKFQVTKWEENK